MRLDEYKIKVKVDKELTYVDSLMTRHYFKYDNLGYIRNHYYTSRLHPYQHKVDIIYWIRQPDGFIEYELSTNGYWFKRDLQYFKHRCSMPKLESEFLKQRSCN